MPNNNKGWKWNAYKALTSSPTYINATSTTGVQEINYSSFVEAFYKLSTDIPKKSDPAPPQFRMMGDWILYSRIEKDK